GEAKEPQKAFLIEAFTFGGELGLDHLAVARKDEIAIAAGLAILLIVKIEHRLAAVNAAADSPYLGPDRVLGQGAIGQQPVDGNPKGHPCPGDGGGAGAAIGLDHVAIDDDLAFAELGQVDDGAEASADQPLDLLGAPRL